MFFISLITVMLKRRVFRNVMIAIVAILFSTSVNTQNNEYIKLLDDTITVSDSCLTNSSDYSRFKLQLPDSSITINNLKIQTEANYKNREFYSIDKFNQFDFKFWLLSNDSYKTYGNFKNRTCKLKKAQ